MIIKIRKYLIENGASTITEISKTCGINKIMVNHIISELIKRQIVKKERNKDNCQSKCIVCPSSCSGKGETKNEDYYIWIH